MNHNSVEKLDVLAWAAHPDDTELCCSGTLAALVKQGLKVGVVDLTRGDMGTRGTPEQRLDESQNAAKALGLSIRDNLGLPDTLLDNTPEHRKVIIQALRRYRPDICFITAPDDRHPDHGNATRLLIDAFFYSGLKMIQTEDKNGETQEKWRPYHILHYMQDRTFEPDFVYDVSDTIALKKKAILSFKSQFNVPESDDGPQTYISGNRFFESIIARARFYGHMIGVEFGEPFKYHGGPVPLSDLEIFRKNKPMR